MEDRIRPRSLGVPVPTTNARRPPAPLWSAARLVALLALLPALLAFSGLVVYRASHDDLIYPGVSVRGIDLASQTRDQARRSILGYVDAVGRRPFTLRYDDGEFRTTLTALGLSLPDDDLEQLVDRAWRSGREDDLLPWVRSQVTLLRRGFMLPLSPRLDRERGRLTLRRFAEELDETAVNAHLSIERAGAVFEVHTTPARPGRRLNVEATLDRLQRALEAIDLPNSVPALVEQTHPAITDEYIAAARDRVTRALAGPLTFQRDDGRSWAIAAIALLDVVEITGLETGAPPVDVRIKQEQLHQLVVKVADQADQPAQNPRLALEGTEVVVQPGAPGRLVDRDAAARDALEQLTGDSRTIVLKMGPDQPWVLEADLTEIRAQANARLALPLTLEFADQRWKLERKDLSGFLLLPNTQLLPRPSPTPAAGAAVAQSAGLSRAAPAGQPTPTQAPARPRLPIDVTLDRAKIRTYLGEWVAPWVARDPVDASLQLRERRMEVRPGQTGVAVDYDGTAADMVRRFHLETESERVVRVGLVARPPRVTESALVAARDAANLLIGRPVVVRSPVGDWTITVDELIAMLRFQGTPPSLAPFLSRERLVERIEAIAREADTRAAAAALRSDAGGPRRADVLMTAAAAWASAQTDDRSADLHWVPDD